MRAIKGSITVLGWGEWEVGRDAGVTMGMVAPRSDP